jgi:hypothetical protein
VLLIQIHVFRLQLSTIVGQHSHFVAVIEVAWFKTCARTRRSIAKFTAQTRNF